MNIARLQRGWIKVCLLTLVMAGYNHQIWAQEPAKTPPPPQAQSVAPQAPAPAPATLAERETWRRAVVQVPKPKRGCFTANYPDRTWKEVPCGTPPNKPYPPRSGLRGQTVGNGVDYSANTNGATTAAEGTFASITGVTSESTVQPGQPSGTANQFSLQLNTQFFQTQTCSGSSAPGSCQGWEQFVVTNDPTGTSYVFIQYWLLNYNTTCPAGWYTYAVGTSTFCYTNSAQATAFPTQTIAQLGSMALIGTAAGGGADDSSSLNIAGTIYSASGNNYFPDLGQKWQVSEFNIFGDCCGSSAVFNAGSAITVQTAVNYGSPAAPSCAMEGFTGETNNLTLVGTPSSAPAQPWPSVSFNQNNSTAPTPASCATANSSGDTHILTFAGVAYDFQAAGQFLLLNSGNGFNVYANQISGAPSWPNTSVNGSISTQIGNVSVVVSATGQTITVNGTPFSIPDGQSRIFGQGVQITHNGVGYLISSPTGDRVEAFLRSANPNYMDVFVYPGQTLPAGATGALVGKTQTKAMTPKLSFSELYNQYAKEWSAAAKTSNLAVKASAPVVLPKKPFFAKQLTAAQQEHGNSVCKAAGVTDPTLLENCILDVTVIGKDDAAEVFTHMSAPKSVVTGDGR